MLYDFHHKQNTKKPGTVHATYLLTGIRRVTTSSQTNGIHSQDDEDIPMQSSPPLPSSSAAEPHDSIPESSIIRSILLVREEHLAQAKSTFDSISSIHIYSLECNGLSDIHTLTECNRQIDVNYASEDPLQAWKQYGTIQNPNVKRRVGKGTAPPPPAAPIEKNPQAKIAPSATTAKAKEAEMKAEVKPAAAVPTEKKGSTTTSFPKPVQAKRQNSDIFKSFSKAKPPAAASPVPADPDPKGEDDLMTGFSDDEGLDDDELEKEVGEAAKTLQPAGKSKKEREAELQAMMEQEDEEDEAMEDVTAATPDAAPAADVDAPAKAEEAEEPKETVTIENGRRRGKRRIMKKKTVKDEDGYLGMASSLPAASSHPHLLTLRRQ